MKVVLTGGHMSPALAVIEKLKENDILYIGRKYAFEGDDSLSLEFKTINSLGINFAELKTGRLQRKFTRHTLSSFFKIPFGFWQGYKILSDFNPDVVVGFGGYLSLPVVFAAAILKIPIVLHEQTLEAGLANKILSRFAKKICISFTSSFDFFPKEKTILTGNPLRIEIINAKKINFAKNKTPLVYITGGSSGSHKLNLLIEKTINNLLLFAKVIHQTGDAGNYNDFTRLSKLREKMNITLKKKYQLVKFLDPMEVGKTLVKSDLIISRAGINTVSEIIYLEKPAIFIPLPFAQRDEQLKNAIMAKESGIAEIFEEAKNPEIFLDLVKNMICSLENYKLKRSCLIADDSAQRIVKIISETAKSESL